MYSKLLAKKFTEQFWKNNYSILLDDFEYYQYYHYYKKQNKSQDRVTFKQGINSGMSIKHKVLFYS